MAAWRSGLRASTSRAATVPPARHCPAGAAAPDAAAERHKIFVGPALIALAKKHLAELMALAAEVAVMLEPGWKGKVAEVEQKLSKIKEDRKLISVAPRTEEPQSEQSSEEDLC